MHLADRFAEYHQSPLNSPTKIVDGRAVTTPRKKVLIYGAGFFREDAEKLLKDDSWEVWAINLIPPLTTSLLPPRILVRADRWFDIHQRKAQTKDDIRWIGMCPYPIYLPPDLVDASPNGVLYPLEEIEAKFRISYWACTFAYQIALAIHEGFEEIGLYGVELAYGTQRERSLEFANVAFWLGMAFARGVVIHTPDRQGSRLMQHPGRYGFEYTEELEAVKKYSDFMDEGDDARREMKESGMNVGG